MRILFLGLFLLFSGRLAIGQVESVSDSLMTGGQPDSTVSEIREYDIGNFIQGIFNPRRATDTLEESGGAITLLPNLAYNPSIGAQIGVKAVAGKVLGNEPGTLMSVAATSGSITTKGILVFYLNHNIFTPGNRWNFQGNWRMANMLALDYGLGMGGASGASPEENVLFNPERNLYSIRYTYYNFTEKVYKQLVDNIFLGGGVSFDFRQRINDQSLDEGETPHHVYSTREGFNADRYAANGVLLNVQYTTRDHPNRAYSGIYSDIGIRVNQGWLGSTKGSVQLITDFRKYWSLSDQHPEHVLAFWHWGSYLISGTLPYLELPGTGTDTYNRSGRGYTIGYYRGPSFFYSELEYRFPITSNRFLSGVVFANAQSVSNPVDARLFQQWQPAAGAGLRVFFNKATRTNLCLDYAFGRYGARGFFLGLNEVF